MFLLQHKIVSVRFDSTKLLFYNVASIQPTFPYLDLNRYSAEKHYTTFRSFPIVDDRRRKLKLPSFLYSNSKKIHVSTFRRHSKKCLFKTNYQRNIKSVVLSRMFAINFASFIPRKTSFDAHLEEKIHRCVKEIHPSKTFSSKIITYQMQFRSKTTSVEFSDKNSRFDFFHLFSTGSEVFNKKIFV